jgi:hypothetical protein
MIRRNAVLFMAQVEFQYLPIDPECHFVRHHPCKSLRVHCTFNTFGFQNCLKIIPIIRMLGPNPQQQLLPGCGSLHLPHCLHILRDIPFTISVLSLAIITMRLKLQECYGSNFYILRPIHQMIAFQPNVISQRTKITVRGLTMKGLTWSGFATWSNPGANRKVTLSAQGVLVTCSSTKPFTLSTGI